MWLYELGVALGKPASLDDVADTTLDRIAADGFDWVWLLGIWQTGQAGLEVSRSRVEWQQEYRDVLPDFTADDVCGSPFAVTEYVVNRDFGGPRALDRFRRRLAERRIRLMLDFVPNHTALDHRWAHEHPEFYIQGSEDDVAREPENYCRVATRLGPRVLAHGRDPYFPAWADTLQVNHRHRGFRDSLLDVLDNIVDQCDGIRCDMAMLVLPEIIERIWGQRARPADGSAPLEDSLWPAAIARARRRRSDFVFLAEAYWNLERALQQQGFDYTYDKRLYDYLRARDAGAVRTHLLVDHDYQRRSARFLENHDEPRAAAAFAPPVHRAAAVLTLLAPGLRFVQDGQLEGRRLRTSNHLRRRAVEPVARELASFYERLLACSRRAELRDGDWELLACERAWDDNPTWSAFMAFSREAQEQRLVVVVNYGDTQGQCYVRLPWTGLDTRAVVLHDLMNSTVCYERDGADLSRRGLYLDMAAWGYHVFEVSSA